MPNEHVLGGRDLLRNIQGTWLGVTKDGRIAVLTNFREEGQIIQEVRSRGAVVNAFLTQSAASAEDTEGFVRSLVEEGEGLKGIGGFTLLCGKAGMPLAVVSNRTPNVEDLSWILGRKGETIGLSNATFGDRSWPKVLKGEELIRAAIRNSVARKDTKAEFVEEMMKVLSVNELPSRKQKQGWESYSKELRKSIFIPLIGGEGMDDVDPSDHLEIENPRSESTPMDALGGVYGTQTQTVVLADHQGLVTFVERRLYDSSAQAIEGDERDQVFEFQIEQLGGVASSTTN
jgi:uncharacterized protein with NRDE domain